MSELKCQKCKITGSYVEGVEVICAVCYQVQLNKVKKLEEENTTLPKDP